MPCLQLNVRSWTQGMGPLLGSSSLFLEIRHDAQRILGDHEFLVGWNHNDFNRGIVTRNEALFAVVIAAVLLLVKDNAQRLQTAIRQKKAVRGEDGKYHFASTSFDANALNADPALGLSYIVAPPRMQRYLDVSTQIYKTYLKYVSPADIYPYSIDEVFIDVTGYLPYYHMSAHDLAMTMVREVLYNTGITATAGIGTNLYLAKLAMDIVAKHIPADKDGVRIAELDEQSYRYLLWNHRPLTDFWMTGPGTVKNLAHFSDSLISPPSGAATPPAESRPDSASSPTRSRPRT